jgi:serine/threonine-protein kinase PpkA
MSRIVSISLLAALLLSGIALADRPLLLPGKTSIYQRVLTRPGAELSDQAGAAPKTLVDAFSRLYVYQRVQQDGKQWLGLGADTEGRQRVGWMLADQTVPWKQQLTLAFTNPAGRPQRLLFFDSREDLDQVLDAPDTAAVAGSLAAEIARGGRDPKIVAMEPETFVDINNQFYLLPILDYRERASRGGEVVRTLEVASITKPEPPAAVPTPAPQSLPAAPVTPLRSFKAGVVFVIDSTISMQPYIQETRGAVRRIYERMRKAGVLDRASFGLVAFRAHSSDPKRDSALEYVAKEFADPSQISDADGFLEHVRTLHEARVSTDHFDEDAYAGVLEAIDHVDWKELGARYIVLVTDAGSLSGTDSTTGLDAERLRSLAGEQGIAIYVLHLKTPTGKDDHTSARQQYVTLAQNAAVQDSLYFPVETGSVHRFRQVVDTLADSLIENVKEASTGKEAPGSAATATRPPQPAPRNAASTTAAPGSQDPELARLRAITSALGHAMQLAYLGKERQTRAPTVFEGWISDRDFADPTKRTLEVRVLLTKNQLSDLQMILQKIVHAAEEGMLKPDSFFNSLRSIASQFGRDPSLATRPEATRLADLGLLEEYLSDLPYRSEVMALDQDTWTHWGPQRQVDFINRLKGKVRLYARYNADWQRWVDLAQNASADTGEWVYPVPLTDLP